MAVVMLCYARSGGTFLNKCIGALPGTIILSELNPLGGGWGAMGADSYDNVHEQALHWYNIDVGTNDFAKGLEFLESYCVSHAKKLVVRDWSFVNFACHEYNKCNPPNRFLTLEVLQGRFPLTVFGFVRDSIDVWISRRCPDIDQFYSEYYNYLSRLTKLDIPLFKYEDLCSDPIKTMHEICEYTGIEYQDIQKSYVGFNYVNGDTQGESRGSAQDSIQPLERRKIERKQIKRINASRLMKECNAMLGYKQSY